MGKILGLAVLLGAAAALAEVPSAMAVRNARVVTVAGSPLAHGTVVWRNGLIEAVGENITIPPDAWVIEGEGLTVYPGLIDGMTTLGITDESALPLPPAPPPGSGRGSQQQPQQSPPVRGPEDRPMTTSWLKAADLVKSTDTRIAGARNAGFTTAVTFPMRGIFAGQGAVINLAGDRPGKMVVASPVGQFLTFITPNVGSFPGSLMGAFAYVRQIYLDVDHYRMAKQMYAKNPSGMARPDYDRALEGVMESERVLLPAQRVVDIDRMIRFAGELKLKPVLYGVPTGYVAADLLAKSGVPVLVSLKWPERPRDADPDHIDTLKTLRLFEDAPRTPKTLAASHVKFGLYSGGITRRTDLWKAVKRAMEAGLSADEAVRAFTLSNAEIFGVADRLGSIEKGKIANLVITNGDLFEENTRVQWVIVDGRKFEPVPEPAPAGEREETR
jgi:hypothetical protein